MTQDDHSTGSRFEHGVVGRDAFHAMLEREMPNLKRYALSLTRDPSRADDLLQDCLVRAIRKRRQFRKGTYPRRWLFTILRNLHLDSRRRYARRGPHVPLDEWRPEGQPRAPQDDVLALLDLRRAQRRLRPCDREVLYLSAFSKLSQKDIARRLGIAEGTVRSRLSRSRAALVG